MARLHQTHVTDASGLAELRRPRDDVVGERLAAPDRFLLAHGPLLHYERTLAVRDRGETAEAGDGRRFEVDETFRYKVAGAPWNLLLALPFRRALRRRRPAGAQPWWGPPERLDAQQAATLALLGTLAVVSAYLGTTLSQTLTFVAEDFGADKTAQATVLSLARIGVLVSLVATGLADRNGRRLVRLMLVAACAIMAGAALVPNLAAFGMIQTAARGLTIATDIIVLVLAAETMPVRCRAWAASILTLIGGLGSGMVVWLLPLADLSIGAWRLIYLPTLLFIPMVVWVGRRLPESGRFLAAAHNDEREHRRVAAERRLHRPVVIRRLALLGVAAFLLLAFSAPASQFQNEFLRDERGFSAARITLFTLLTSTPAGLGVFIGGRLTDTLGRRPVGALGIALGSVAVAMSFASRGWPMWAWAVASTVTGGMAVPAIRVYGPELFPTHLRSRANGITTLCAVCGSATGIQLAGRLAEDRNFGTLTWPIALLVVGPLLVAVLVLTVYPETGGRTLEELNPGDVGPERTVVPPSASGLPHLQ